MHTTLPSKDRALSAGGAMPASPGLFVQRTRPPSRWPVRRGPLHVPEKMMSTVLLNW